VSASGKNIDLRLIREILRSPDESGSLRMMESEGVRVTERSSRVSPIYLNEIKPSNAGANL